MSDARLDRLERVFQAAADLAPEERSGFLERECGDDVELRDRVEAMLRVLENDHSLPRPTFTETVATDRAGVEGPGTVIDRYKLLQKIGEGGFGVVYMAEQEQPVVRRVALKIIKLGMDTREVVARFEAERQALAMMDHANIARVLDGGATPGGRPYFVMELVRGVSITEYCDANKLATRERLALFIEVCHAVQHAHQKGIIHRDLKPSNVLVTLHDGKPIPKVIDFGVAKATHGRLTDKTLFTRYEQFIGTPAYMSPEQAEMSAIDIDTRTDIYALGVLLYELLTGTTPFDATTLFRAGFAEIQRVIRDEPPERPSLRVSTAAAATIASRGGRDGKELSRRIKGDLDWIVMKALEKERVRRYATANELAEDVNRHLQNEPVLAGRPGTIYRARKFLQRNQAAALSILLITLLLIGGIIGTSLGMFEAAQARDNALDAQRHAEAVTDFLVGTLSLTDPEVALRSDVSVRTLLDRAGDQVEAAFRDRPLAEARLRLTIGKAYASLAANGSAEGHLRRAIELFARHAAENRPVRYETLWALTHVLFQLERPDAMGVAQEARRVAHDHVRQVNPGLAESLDAFIEQVNHGAYSGDARAVEEASRLFRAGRDRSHREMKPDDPLWPLLADTWIAGGYTFWYGPAEAASQDWWAEAYEIQSRTLGPAHPDVANTLSQYVGVLNRAGRAAEAESRMREMIEALRGSFAKDSFQVAYAESMLGDNLVQQGKFEEAEPLLVRTHQIILELMGPTTVFVVDSYLRMLSLYDGWGRPDRAGPYRAEYATLLATLPYIGRYPMARHAFGPGTAEVGRCLDAIHEECGGISYAATEGTRVSDTLGADVDALVEVCAREFAVDDPLRNIVGRLLVGWSNALDPRKMANERRRIVDVAGEMLEPWRNVIPLDVADLLAMKADGAGPQGREIALEAFEVLRTVEVPDSWYTANARIRIARTLVKYGLSVEAEPILRRNHELVLKEWGADHPDAREARRWMVRLLRESGRVGEVGEWEWE